MTVLAILVIPACKPSSVVTPSPAAPKTWTVNRGAETITLNNVAGDLMKANARGDKRFVGEMGLGLFLPGVDGDQQKLISKYGVKVLDGISDVVDAATASVREPAHAYAVQYNRLLLAELQAVELIH